jgi:LEA14-like dessication related protein
MNFLRIAIIFIISIALTHCADLMNILKKGGVEKPDVRISKTNLTGLTFEQADLVFDIEIKNPNTVGISLAGFDYDLLLNDVSFLNGEQNKQMEIKANDTAIIQLPVSLLYKNIYQTYQRLKNNDNIHYSLKTGLNFNLPVLGEVRIPVSTSGDFPAIKIPKISIKSIKMERLSLTGADFNLAIGIKNPNGFGFNINNLDYRLMINQTRWAEGQKRGKMSIQSKKESILLIPFKLNFMQIGASLYQEINSGNKFNYQLTGKTNLSSSIEALGNVNFPFDVSGTIDLSR